MLLLGPVSRRPRAIDYDRAPRRQETVQSGNQVGQNHLVAEPFLPFGSNII